LRTDAPWWLLTHYPQAGDVFSWLDGIAICAYIGAYASAVGGAGWLALRGAVRIAGRGRYDWKSLSLALVPIAGTGLFLGLSMMTLNHLRAEGWVPPGIGPLRAVLVTGAALWSVWLGARIVARSDAALYRRAGALALYLVPVALACANWYLIFVAW
jgi:hypothetical protein